MNILYLGLIFMGLFGFGELPYKKKYYQFVNDFNCRVKKQYNLDPSMTGGGLTGDISLVSVGYIKYEYVDVETARKMFVDIFEHLVKQIEIDTELRPFLHQYPFPENKTEFTIMFVGRDNPTSGKYCANFARFAGGVIYDVIDFDTGERVSFKEDYNETYQKVYGHPRPCKQN